MGYPAKKPIKKELLVNNPCYDSQLLKLLKIYYDGGPSFPIESELRHRPMELSGDPRAAPLRASRVEAAFYTSYFQDALGDLSGDICKDELTIDDVKERPYWLQFQNCTDGSYTSATAQSRAALTDDFLYNLSWYCVSFPEPKEPGANLAEQIKNGDLDARICNVDAMCVTNWTLDKKNGGVIEARTYEIELEDGPEGPYTMERHNWTFYGTDEVATYQATKKVTDSFDEDATAALKGEAQSHSLGVCPMFKVERKFKCWVGSKMLPTVKQLFNEESDSSFNTFMQTTAGHSLFTDSPGKYEKGVSWSAFAMPMFGINDKVERDKVDGPALSALAAAAAERRGQLRGLIHEQARQTGSQSASGQNTSHTSGKAIQASRDPLAAWLLGFAEAQIACWRKMISAICEMREEDDEDISVAGLMGSIQNEDDPIKPDRMQAEQIFSQLPNVPDSAKEARGRELGLEANPQADEDLVKLITEEEIEPPEPPAPIVIPPIGPVPPIPEKQGG